MRMLITALSILLLAAPPALGGGPDLRGLRKTCYGGPKKMKKAPPALRASVKRWRSLGIKFFAEGKYAEAKRELGKALQIGGDEVTALRAMGAARANLGEADAARACAELLDQLEQK